MTKKRQNLGVRGEEEAARFLQNAGYTIVERNFRVRYGEIDIIARKEEELVFVEVRTTSSTEFGGPLATVTRKKQRQIIRIANMFLAQRGLTDDCNCRFDVIGLVPKKDGSWHLEHISEAFEAI